MSTKSLLNTLSTLQKSPNPALSEQDFLKKIFTHESLWGQTPQEKALNYQYAASLHNVYVDMATLEKETLFKIMEKVKACNKQLSSILEKSTFLGGTRPLMADVLYFNLLKKAVSLTPAVERVDVFSPSVHRWYNTVQYCLRGDESLKSVREEFDLRLVLRVV